MEDAIHLRKIFDRSVKRMHKDCDLIDVMREVKMSQNFQRTFLER